MFDVGKAVLQCSDKSCSLVDMTDEVMRVEASSVAGVRHEWKKLRVNYLITIRVVSLLMTGRLCFMHEDRQTSPSHSHPFFLHGRPCEKKRM